MRDSLLIIASAAELPPGERVWGTGGWRRPETREALDWLTLGRLLGFPTEVRYDAPSEAHRWIVIAGDPQQMLESGVSQVERLLKRADSLVITRTASYGGAFSGTRLDWTGPGPTATWQSRKPIPATPLPQRKRDGECEIWATLDGSPLITARRCGVGRVVTLGFHPSAARDASGDVMALLRRLLIYGVAGPVAWLDFDGCVVLRMDDPGGAQNAHLRSWAYSKLTEPQWGEIATDLAHRKARLSMAYVSGWVDDGDPSRGLLEVNGAPVPRIKGQVLPSPAVVYRSCSGMVQDGASEFRGIQALRASGLGDVELHGYTHMHPDLTAWASAEDRYDSVEWYRELGPSAEWILRTLADKDHPIALGLRALRRHFDVQPTTLISPGDQWTNTVLEFALRHGVQLIDSYYLAIRHDNRFCWSTHVCSPYLDEPDQSWFDSGLPTVGYFHDMEPSRHGAGWLTRCLDSWEQAGARRFIDFRELAGALSLTFHVSHNNGCFSLKVRQDSGPPLVRPVKLAVKTSNSGLPQTLWIQTETQEIDLRS